MKRQKQMDENKKRQMSWPNLGLTLLLLGVFSCGPALETREETDQAGYRTEYQVSPESGEREGFARRYDPAGNLISEELYTAGKLEGKRTAYYPDGSVELVENYREGLFHGEYITYDSSGNLRLLGNYTDGVMSDTWFRYWPNGRMREEVTVSDNKENGPFREWYENGEPRAAGTYKEGKESGPLWQFDEDGQLSAVRECEAGVCSAVWKAETGGDAPGTPPDMTRPADLEANR